MTKTVVSDFPSKFLWGSFGKGLSVVPEKSFGFVGKRGVVLQKSFRVCRFVSERPVGCSLKNPLRVFSEKFSVFPHGVFSV